MEEGRLTLGRRPSFPNQQSSLIRCLSQGHTLVEVVTVVLVLSILACIAVPRLNLAAVWGARADALVQRLATDLRHTRALAIAQAAQNPGGFVLVLEDADPCRRYQIIDCRDRTVAVVGDIPAGVQCRGGRRFAFGPLGSLQDGSDTHLRIGTEGKAYVIEIVPATGAVEWRRE
jgi:prepilin-type N-terminal cleavage/methylation domain-containing protein